MDSLKQPKSAKHDKSFLSMLPYIQPKTFLFRLTEFVLSKNPLPSFSKYTMGYSRKKTKQQEGGLRTHFFENHPGIFRFFTLPLEIPDKAKLQHP